MANAARAVDDESVPPTISRKTMNNGMNSAATAMLCRNSSTMARYHFPFCLPAKRKNFA